MAGRKNKYTVDYFPHYCKGLESKTMFILENKFGLIGYAVWYKTLELLGKTEYHYLDLRDDTDLLFLISKLGISEDKFIQIYDLLAKVNAIDIELWNNKIIFSDNFVSNIEDAYVRRKGINVLHKFDLCKHLSIKCKQKLPKERKGEETKENNIKERETEFKNSLQQYLDLFGKDLLDNFFMYWTEKKPKGKKMRFEMEKTFDIKRRLDRWNNNNFNKQNNKDEKTKLIADATDAIRKNSTERF